jgi:hypothetical protein
MLNLEFFSDDLPEKKVYLVDMSILSILLSPEPGCHMTTSTECKKVSGYFLFREGATNAAGKEPIEALIKL